MDTYNVLKIEYEMKDDFYSFCLDRRGLYRMIDNRENRHLPARLLQIDDM